MISRLLLLILPLAAAACDTFPQDPDGTLKRVKAERAFKVGYISSEDPVGLDRQKLFIGKVAEQTGARPEVEAGSAERLLARLEEGQLDVVLGEMTPSSPWAKRVTFLPLLGEQVSSDEHVLVVAAAKNGENAWISLLHKQAVKVGAQR